jgi:phosphatidylglycerophosphatase A
MAVTRLSAGLLRDPVHLVALGFGSGLAPFAPGTAGTLLAVLPAWLTTAWPWPLRLGLVALLFAAGIWICGESARRLGVHDHPGIVFDEVVGYLATCLAAPANAVGFLAAFMLFRCFDVLKPWPIRDVDHSLRGGVGIMLDDLMAAAYGAACLLLYQYFFP